MNALQMLAVQLLKKEGLKRPAAHLKATVVWAAKSAPVMMVRVVKTAWLIWHTKWHSLMVSITNTSSRAAKASGMAVAIVLVSEGGEAGIAHFLLAVNGVL